MLRGCRSHLGAGIQVTDRRPRNRGTQGWPRNRGTQGSKTGLGGPRLALLPVGVFEVVGSQSGFYK